jgi:hypothetical protein
MSPELKTFLHMLRPPSRLNGTEASWRLGLNREELRIISSTDTVNRIRESLSPKERNGVLSNATRLRPLGKPAKMATKYFFESEIARLEQDVEWLDKAVRTIRLYWKLKKHGKDNFEDGDTN